MAPRAPMFVPYRKWRVSHTAPSGTDCGLGAGAWALPPQELPALGTRTPSWPDTDCRQGGGARRVGASGGRFNQAGPSWGSERERLRGWGVSRKQPLILLGGTDFLGPREVGGLCCTPRPAVRARRLALRGHEYCHLPTEQPLLPVSLQGTLRPYGAAETLSAPGPWGWGVGSLQGWHRTGVGWGPGSGHRTAMGPAEWPAPRGWSHLPAEPM